MSSVHFESEPEERILPKLDAILPEDASEAIVSMDMVEAVLVVCLCLTILSCFYTRICLRGKDKKTQ